MTARPAGGFAEQLACWLGLIPLLVGAATAAGADPAIPTFREKTLVAWVRAADLVQRGTGVLSIENMPGEFDSIVMGEITPGKWMAGSDYFRRTVRDQGPVPAETAGPETLLQMAIVYEGDSATVYRDAKVHSRAEKAGPLPAFGPISIVLLGSRACESSGLAFRGSIADARIYDRALDVDTLAKLKPDQPSDPPPLAWWDFQDGTLKDRMGRYAEGYAVGGASISGGELRLEGGHVLVNVDRPRSRDVEDWPTYHISALPDEGLARPYDANGCIFWKGKYHLMYIYQDRKRPKEGHSWGHLSSTDLVNWTIHPPALLPEPGDPDTGIFSGNAFLNADGTPMLCWFGVDAGVCVATAEDDDLVRWKKHSKNPIIPLPKPGEPGHGQYRVWDPNLWREGDRYVCLLGGNTLPNGKDTLDTWTSTNLVDWTRRGPFYEHPDLSWTGEGEDCSCPDFFQLGDRHVLLCISHKVGARAYIGRYDPSSLKFQPEQHVRMNWPGGQFFAPESLLAPDGRRIIWAWVTDPRTITTQQHTGSGVQSLPRVLALAADATLTITPADELKSLRREGRSATDVALPAETDVAVPGVRGDTIELAVEIEPGAASVVEVDVRRSPDGSERTTIRFDPKAGVLALDMTRSTRRPDVVYAQHPLDTGAIIRAADYPTPRATVEAPLTLKPGEPLRLRIFLDRPMLEVFANNRQALTQQVFPSDPASVEVAFRSRGAGATLRKVEAWEMAPARFVDRRKPAG